MVRIRSHFARACGLLLMAGALCACASLPALDEVQPAAAPVEIESTRGTLSPAKSDALIEEAGGSGADRDVLQRHLAFEEAVNPGSPLVSGNRVQLLQDGPATYASMVEAITAARHHVNLETYIFEADETGEKFAQLLRERAAAGISVNILYDAVGSLRTPPEFFESLRAAGINVVAVNPVSPLADNPKPWKINNRDHRKILVVDGRTAFVGGINISDVYSSGPFARPRAARAGKDPDAPGWRDTHVRIDGPAAKEFQQLFLDTWTRQQGPELPPGDWLPDEPARGDEIVRAMGARADAPENPIYLTLLSAIGHAERRIDLTIAYFAPNDEMLGALTAAARRGVKVRLILPSWTDSWLMLQLGRSYYEPLLRAGVEVHERRGALMHAKTVSIDGVWHTIGSTNLDWRSFVHNDEVNAVILGREIGVQMEAMFARDIGESRQITLQQWRRRSVGDRMAETFARLFAYWF